MTATVVCIVDYHNFYPHRGTGHRSPLEDELAKMVRIAVEADPSVQRVNVRLYGGWYQDGVLTKEASEVQEEVNTIDLFPLRHPSGRGLLHGDVELIARLAALPEVSWDRTLKQVQGLTRLRVETERLPDTCTNHKDRCPVLILRRFARKKKKTCGVIGCTQLNEDVFVRRQQKMVDAMMVCDVMELAGRDDVTGILTFTDDVDVLPGLAVARPKGTTTLKLVVRSSRLKQEYKAFLSRIGVEHVSWERNDV